MTASPILCFHEAKSRQVSFKSGGQDAVYQSNANFNEQRGALKLCVTLW